MKRSPRALTLLLLSSALCLGGAGGAAGQSGSSFPDVIFHHGKVFTSDPGNLWVQAVAVDGNRIQAVGSDAEVLGLAGPATKLLDLQGRTVIPGLNDAHVHALVPQGVQLNLPDFLPGPDRACRRSWTFSPTRSMPIRRAPGSSPPWGPLSARTRRPTA